MKLIHRFNTKCIEMQEVQWYHLMAYRYHLVASGQ